MGADDRRNSTEIGIARMAKCYRRIFSFFLLYTLSGTAVEISSPVGFGAWAFGYIDTSGRFAIEPQYKWARSFSEGLAATQDTKTGKWGYIDKSGQILISAQFDRAWDFHESMALVELKGKRQFIDKSGTVAATGFSTAYDFSEGLAAANFGGKTDNDSPLTYYVSGGKWRFIDRSGSNTIAQIYDCAYPFHEGLAANQYWRNFRRWLLPGRQVGLHCKRWFSRNCATI
jgi:hypothetical protein